MKNTAYYEISELDCVSKDTQSAIVALTEEQYAGAGKFELEEHARSAGNAIIIAFLTAVRRSGGKIPRDETLKLYMNEANSRRWHAAQLGDGNRISLSTRSGLAVLKKTMRYVQLLGDAHWATILAKRHLGLT